MTDLFVLVICAGVSAKTPCKVHEQAGFYSKLQCEQAKREMVLVDPGHPPAHVLYGKETDDRWTTYAYCRPGTPVEVRRWDKEGKGP